MPIATEQAIRPKFSLIRASYGFGGAVPMVWVRLGVVTLSMIIALMALVGCSSTPTPSDGATEPTSSDPYITVFQGTKATVDSYYIGITTHNFPSNVACQVVDHSGGVTFASTVTLRPNESRDSNSHLISFDSGVWVKVRCWNGEIDITSGELHF
jgi:hypothetical protein